MLGLHEFANDLKRFSANGRLIDLIRLLTLRRDVVALSALYLWSANSEWSREGLNRPFLHVTAFVVFYLLIVRYCVNVISPINFGTISLARLDDLIHPGTPWFGCVARMILLPSQTEVSTHLIRVNGTSGRTYVTLVRDDASWVAYPLLDENERLVKMLLATATPERRALLIRKIETLRSHID